MLKFIPIFFLLFLPLFSQEEAEDIHDIHDIEVLRDWLDTQRKVTIKELGGRLSISGEVRCECQGFGESRNGVKQLGFSGATDFPSRAYDIEVNLLIDYRADRTWASIKLEFDNNAGLVQNAEGSGTFNNITTERALFGCRAIEGDVYTFDVVFGRRRLNYTFDSRIEFNSFMDGVVLKYDHALDRWGDLFIHTGPFIVNERFDHYAWVGELGLLNIYNTGFFGKYSFVKWNTRHFSDSIKADRFRFMVSQLSGGYKFVPQPWNKNMTFYWAWLINHAAQGVEQTLGRKENQGWYLGFSFGEARKKGDISFDINYQWVQAQAIPGFDVSGIGRFNAQRVGFYSQIVNGQVVPTTNATATGSSNYRGWTMQLLYLWTNNLTMFQSWSQSTTLSNDIGPFIRFKMYEVELIYAF
ncbi:MAG: hypothetical protein WDZ28_00225 [Simkaniaceae bacterium]